MKPKTKRPDANAELRERLDAEFREKWIPLATRNVIDNPNCKAWLRLFVILDEAMRDSEILSSRAASQFLEVMRELAADSFTCDEAIQAFRPLAPILAGDQLRDNTGRIKGGDTMERLKEAHIEILKQPVIDILRNPKTFDWTDPEIARWLMKPERAYHERKGKPPLGLKTMTTRVAKIRADYKASI